VIRAPIKGGKAHNDPPAPIRAERVPEPVTDGVVSLRATSALLTRSKSLDCNRRSEAASRGESVPMGGVLMVYEMRGMVVDQLQLGRCTDHRSHRLSLALDRAGLASGSVSVATSK